MSLRRGLFRLWAVSSVLWIAAIVWTTHEREACWWCDDPIVGQSQKIEVHAPNGAVVEFPAGTSPDVISSVMAKNFGGVIRTFDFTDPNGKRYTVTGPDGSTPEQAFAILQQYLGHAPQPQRAAGPKRREQSLSGVCFACRPGRATRLRSRPADHASRPQLHIATAFARSAFGSKPYSGRRSLAA